MIIFVTRILVGGDAIKYNPAKAPRYMYSDSRASKVQLKYIAVLYPMKNNNYRTRMLEHKILFLASNP